MEKNELLSFVAPCSLLCFTCGGYCKGIMKQLSEDFLRQTDGVYEFYEQNAASKECLKQFANFRRMLQQFAQANCEGCRTGNHNGCSIKDCFINECVISHQVDFCGECKEFPCTKTADIFEENILKQWLDGNKKIGKIGAFQYFENQKQLSHYRSYLREE